MKVKGLCKGALVAVLASSAIATAVEPSQACSFRTKFSETSKSLPTWVGFAALSAIAGSVVANEMGKSRASQDS
ncbi:MAG: hypothetical protein SW833_11950 [Cyanobacteriota bacterium]|nr:hypothetical protein [Cyanobacteriota bacterium]